MRFYNEPKYKNHKTAVDGISFDSKAEAERYVLLSYLLKTGEIKDLKLQPVYVLQESFKKNGKTFRAVTYKADFEYFDKKKNKKIVEDVKGVETEVFKIKKKLFEKRYPDLSLTLVR